MPCGGEHDAPLRLVCGADRVLAFAWRALFALALLVGLLKAWPALWKFAFLLVVSASLWAVERVQSLDCGQRLIVAPGGQVELGGRSGRLLEKAWLSARWAVIQVSLDGRRQHLLVSRSRQAAGEYRKLLSWLRWRRWEDD